MNETNIILQPSEFESILKKSEAVLIGATYYFIRNNTDNNEYAFVADADKEDKQVIYIPEETLKGKVEYDPVYRSYKFLDNPTDIPIFKLLSFQTCVKEDNSYENAILPTLDYYPSVPEGKLYCIGGYDVVRKKLLAGKMRELAMSCCPYLIIDSVNSRQFISHCAGNDVITALQNNTRISEVTEMAIKQGINVIVLTARAEIVYILLKDKIENAFIVDISQIDVDDINSAENLASIWH
jgi:hypothetical protein